MLWFHFTNGNPAFGLPAALRATGRHGWVGVEIFFVISGFVLPYALEQRGYGIRDFGRFIGRRLVRLEPPYVVALALTIALAWGSTHLPAYGGAPFSFDARLIALHLVYLVGITGEKWLSPVFWSLALELQFYLLIGVSFPLLAARRRDLALIVALASIAAAQLIPAGVLVFGWLPIFAAGIITWLLQSGRTDRLQYGIALAALALAMFLMSGGLIAVVSVATALAIAFVRIESRVLLYLGAISYSLYLVHVPTGGRVINLAVRLDVGPAGKTIALAAAVAVSLLAAHILYRFVELPSRRRASGLGAGGIAS